MSDLVSNSDMTDQATAANEVAVQIAGTHVGTPTANFCAMYNGVIVSFLNAVPFIADAGLYSTLNGASAPVTWTD